MALGIYKKGQGYWTRSMTAIGAATLVLMGAVWLADNLKNVRIGNLEPVYTQATAAVIIFAVFGWIGYVLIGRNRKSVDFLVATEGEMKKVNWSSKKEIRGSTIVVISLTFVIAIVIFVVDTLYAKLFQAANILEGVGS